MRRILLTCAVLLCCFLSVSPLPARAADGKTRKDRAAAHADKREERQQKRINHGIKKGYLTDDEIKKLQTQQDSLASMESGFKSDGKITKDEAKQLHQGLNDASLMIWTRKHDSEGNQMPTYRLGKNVFARDDLTAKLEDPNLTRADAKAFTHDFHQLLKDEHQLSTADLSPNDRSKLQGEYDELLNKYFEVR